jgi:hypothetical protein
MDSFGKSLRAALAYLGGLSVDPVPVIQSMLGKALTEGMFAENMDALGAKVAALEARLAEAKPAPAGKKA